MRRIAAALLFVLFVACRIFAQEGNATLTGFIQDSSKAVIPGVKVTAIDTNTNQRFEATTGKDGSYTIVSLPVGPYQLQIEKPGFKTILKDDLFLHTQDALEVNFQMAVGSASETVTVDAQSTNDSPAVSLTVSHEFVENMPLNGRSFQDLIQLAPGTVSNAALYSIDGQRVDSNYYTVDGVAANVNVPIHGPYAQFPTQGLAGTVPNETELGTTQSLTSVDSLQEFKIQTSGYSAESGRQPGGEVEFTTRSGSNDTHGSLFEYFRNTVLDANEWFLNYAGIPRPAERQNDFGGTLGGALNVPHLYKGKDKTFYFVSYERLDAETPNSSGILNTPTQAVRQFAAPGVQPFLDALPLPNVQGHLENGDQCAATLDPNYPNLGPDSPYAFSCTGQWESGYSNPSNLGSLSLRVDQSFGSRFHFFARYFDTPSQNYYSGPETDTNTANTHGWTLGNTSAFKSTVVNEFRLNFTRGGGHTGATPTAFDGSVPYAKDLVIDPAYAPGNTPAYAIVRFSISDFDGLSLPAYDNAITLQEQVNVVDGLSVTHGKHQLKFGVDYRRLNPTLTPELVQNYFLLSTIQALKTGFVNYLDVYSVGGAKPVFNNLSLYAQDHWKISEKLTADVGLRWELNPAPGASDGLYPLALTSGNIAQAQIAPQGTSQYRTTYLNFAPRLGFAYAFGNHVHPLVVRAGAGIFYDTGQALGVAGYNGYPFAAGNQLTNVTLPASTAELQPPSLGGPLVQPYQYLSGVSDPNLKLPYTEQWNLAIDLGLEKSNTLTLAYVGNEGKRLLFTGDDIPGSLNPAFTELELTNNAASSNYHALQIIDTGDLTRGLKVIGSFTFAHAIDNSSFDSGYSGGSPAPVRGNSDNDLRLASNLAINYQIPVLESSRTLRALTDKWSTAFRFSAQSGLPVDVIQNEYYAPNGSFEAIRPDLVAGVPLYFHGKQSAYSGGIPLASWRLNYAAFSDVPTDSSGLPLRAGTLPRNYIHGPNFWSLNTVLQRDFHIYEKLDLGFRAEAFNLLNHPNAAGIYSSLNGGPKRFGVATTANTIGAPSSLYGTGSPRSLQLGLRLSF